MYKTTQASRTYCILEQGTVEDYTGFWVEDDDTGEVGLLLDTEDTFWRFDETSSARFGSRVTGRRLRRGPPKRKGKGKGAKGRSKFTPFGKGRRKGGYKRSKRQNAPQDRGRNKKTAACKKR